MNPIWVVSSHCFLSRSATLYLAASLTSSLPRTRFGKEEREKKNEVSDDDCCGHETREREVEECVTQKERKLDRKERKKGKKFTRGILLEKLGDWIRFYD